MLRYSARSVHQWLWVHRPPKKLVVGLAAGLPLLAVVQGSILLSEFRERHSDTPKPHTPSKGVVIAVSHDNKANGVSTMLFHEARRLFLQNSFARTAAPPLRVLVIGDSLAAGVGVSNTATPVLPEAIARTLSMHLDGRVVHYTCIGTPGASAATIVRLIESYSEENSLIVRQPAIPPEIIITEGWIHGWQNYWQRMVGKKDRLQTWWQRLRDKVTSPATEEDLTSSTDEKPTTTSRRQKIVQWWRNLKNHVRALPQAWKEPEVSSADVPDNDDDHDDWQKWQLSLQRRSSLQNAEIVGEFDVAIVLTGLNDLKEAALPFMFRNRRPRVENDASLRDELERVVQALQERMALVLDRSGSSEKQTPQGYMLDSDEENIEAELQETIRKNKDHLLQQRNTSRRRPLVVFPGLPVSPLPVFNSKPLRWFVLPLFRRIDNYKRQVAKQFPGEVLFVDAPTEESFAEVEEGRGELWDDRRAERVLLRLTDINERTRQRVETHMKEYYEKWEKRQAKDPITDYTQTPEERHHSVDLKPYRRPGSSLICVDGVHPNSVGYEFWGRHIALGILEEWRSQDNTR